jgi:hypothetical protein
MSEHTPTPWMALPDESGHETYVVGPKSDHPVADCQFGFGSEDNANAAFIVKAVNNHDALVRALGACCRLIAQQSQTPGAKIIHDLTMSILENVNAS